MATSTVPFPQTVQEAEERFFAAFRRWLPSECWDGVRLFLVTHGFCPPAPPTTIEEWRALAGTLNRVIDT